MKIRFSLDGVTPSDIFDPIQMNSLDWIGNGTTEQYNIRPLITSPAKRRVPAGTLVYFAIYGDYSGVLMSDWVPLSGPFRSLHKRDTLVFNSGQLALTDKYGALGILGCVNMYVAGMEIVR